MRTKTLAVLGLFFFIWMIAMQFIVAVDFNSEISEEDQQTFDQILEPVMKVYNLVKYCATVIAVLILLFAGINYMMSGNNPAKREQSKNMVAYVVIGLIVIWVAPLLVDFIVG